MYMHHDDVCKNTWQKAMEHAQREYYMYIYIYIYIERERDG